jgi:glycine cleavage system H protein
MKMATPESYPDDLLYNSDHDWARIDGKQATFGITWYAQAQLGEIVYWEGAEVGDEVAKGEAYTELESVKAVSEVIAPLSGRIVEINEAALEAPESINQSPYGDGWLVRVSLAAPEETSELLSPSAYKELIES